MNNIEEKKTNGNIGIIVLLTVVLLALVGYIVYDKVYMKDTPKDLDDTSSIIIDDTSSMQEESSSIQKNEEPINEPINEPKTDDITGVFDNGYGTSLFDLSTMLSYYNSDIKGNLSKKSTEYYGDRVNFSVKDGKLTADKFKIVAKGVSGTISSVTGEDPIGDGEFIFVTNTSKEVYYGKVPRYEYGKEPSSVTIDFTKSSASGEYFSKEIFKGCFAGSECIFESRLISGNAQYFISYDYNSDHSKVNAVKFVDSNINGINSISYNNFGLSFKSTGEVILSDYTSNVEKRYTITDGTKALNISKTITIFNEDYALIDTKPILLITSDNYIYSIDLKKLNTSGVNIVARKYTEIRFKELKYASIETKFGTSHISENIQINLTNGSVIK